MVALLTDSEHFSVSEIDREKSWHLLAVLLSIGRPARPAELSARCTLFSASPDFVEFLCLIDNSPLFLTDDLFVTISLAALSACEMFASKAIIASVPRFTLRVPGPKRLWDNIVQTYFRKRKRLREDSGLLPKVKRRLLSPSENDEDEQILLSLPSRIQSDSPEGHIDIANNMIRSMNLLSGDMSISEYDSEILNGGSAMIPLPLDSSIEFSVNGLKNNELLGVENEVKTKAIVHMEFLRPVHTPAYQHGLLNSKTDPKISRPITVERFIASEPDVQLRYLTSIMENPVIRKETQRDEMELENGIDLTISSFLEVDKLCNASAVQAGTHVNHPCEAGTPIEDVAEVSDTEEHDLKESGTPKGHSEKSVLPDNIAQMSEIDEKELDSMNPGNCNHTKASFHREKTAPKVEIQAGTHVNHPYEAGTSTPVEDAAEVSDTEEHDLKESGTAKGHSEKSVLPDNIAQMGEIDEKELDSMNPGNCNHTMVSLHREKTAPKVEIQAVFPSAKPSPARKQPTKSFANLTTVHRDASNLELRVLSGSLEYNKAVNSPKEQEQCKRDQKFISMKQKLKQGRNHNVRTKENMADPTSIALKNHLEPKTLPNFESFILEEEEGSGGYGTVYRARRKNDGKVFAIKCPHTNAQRHHVNNELKMLERFGGRNFVIRYEGSFKSGDSECFVLEHVEHDRPEVLKREIDIFQLQWYGYCMFRALASLHNKGIVHRDVKPGNFLFSRKLNKGYLIDFNLAMDLQQKYDHSSKLKTSFNVSNDRVPIRSTKSALPTKGRKVLGGRIWEAVNREAAKASKSSLEPKNLKKTDVGHLKAYPDLGSKTIFRSQGADGSGITSTKEATSTKTPSAERLREPIPCQGRKELISLVQEAMQSPNHDAVSMPGSQRKRVAAPPGKVGGKLIYLTPMPLHSTGVPVAGAGLLKNKGDGKHKREGPCVGTKGFRAPEVLFRSPHQGSKVDIWSAGVTLLYLMIGRAPFVGDPEQNIKDIAKLRGSEDLWEVAKLHNRESSFPVELFDIQSILSMELWEWCEANTKRPDFLNSIPDSLFDLIDKCLTVNPRCRISADEALRHEFFASCHEDLRKQRLLRRGLSLDSESALLSHEQS